MAQQEPAVEPDPPLDDEAEPEVGELLALRKTEIPVALAELAVLNDRALQIIQTSVKILEILRKSAILATFAKDWVLFRNQVTGEVQAYLDDSGCHRVSKIYGITITRVSKA